MIFQRYSCVDQLQLGYLMLVTPPTFLCICQLLTDFLTVLRGQRRETAVWLDWSDIVPGRLIDYFKDIEYSPSSFSYF